MSSKNYIFNAGIFAPLPPHPPGGIGSIAAILFQGMGGVGSDVKFASPFPKQDKLVLKLVRPIINCIKLIALSIGVSRHGRILVFTSAYGSFYEKILWSSLIILFSRKPVLVSVDGNFPNFWLESSNLMKWLFRKFIENSGLIFVSQSENWKRYYKSIFPGADIRVVSATCAEEFFSYPQLVNRWQAVQEFKLLYIGWVIHDKGVLDLLDAIEILSKHVSNFHLDIVGPVFDRLQYWEDEAASRGLQSNVNFVGALSQRVDLIRALDIATVFVLPSHFEGFPVVLLEAIARGCPCVGTDIGGIPDILDYGKAGLIVSPRNPGQLADALLNLLDNSKLMESISKKARFRATEIYSHQKCLDSYRQLLNVNSMSESAN